ncbi:YeeE/YedE family protein [Spirochaeta dissipatitropha]
MDFLSQSWPWYISGPLLGLMVPLLLFAGNKQFGISSSLRHICTAVLPLKKTAYFNYDWKEHAWSLFLTAGIICGAVIARLFLNADSTPELSMQFQQRLLSWGLLPARGLAPAEIFGEIFQLRSLLMLTLGGFLIGFGTRYANGCTSGHAIMGLSLLNLGSLIAVIGFFIGGLIMSHILLPLILSL